MFGLCPQYDEFDAVAFYNLGTALEAAKEFKVGFRV
jgi:hypothetical protein